MERVRVFVIGLAIYFCPPAVAPLFARWFPTEPVEERPRILRLRFWRAVLIVAGVFAVALLIRLWIAGTLALGGNDWLRVAAGATALAAALGRGGVAITTWKEGTVVERVDRGMYVITQVGVAALLVLLLGY